MTLRLSRRQLLAFTAAGMACARALAQPTKSVRLILPNAVASGVDTLARSIQPALGNTLGASIVVDNQPGAGGIVGLQALARSTPDGLTLSIVSNNVVIFPSVMTYFPQVGRRN